MVIVSGMTYTSLKQVMFENNLLLLITFCNHVSLSKIFNFQLGFSQFLQPSRIRVSYQNKFNLLDQLTVHLITVKFGIKFNLYKKSQVILRYLLTVQIIRFLLLICFYLQNSLMKMTLSNIYNHQFFSTICALPSFFSGIYLARRYF